MTGFTEWTDENDAEIVRRLMKGPEPKLSAEDQAALDKLKCDVCELPSMKDGRCTLCMRMQAIDNRSKLDLNSWKSWCASSGLELCQPCRGDGRVSREECLTCRGIGLK